MKYKNTAHWTDKKNQIGLLFFSQIVDEALFDYTLDSYKPQALNSRLLCVEALQTFDHIKQGLIKKPNLRHIIDELIWSMSNDIALKILVGDKYDRFVENLKKCDNLDRNLRNTINLLYHYLDGQKYLEKIKELLVIKVPVNKEKEDIYFLTKNYLTELINYGYTPSYIYYHTRLYFNNTSSKVADKTPENFFKLFDFKGKKFTVVYKVSKVFQEFKALGSVMKFEIADNYSNPSLKNSELEFIKTKTKDELFVITSEFEALDEVKARMISEVPLSKIANLFSFYHHKERPYISDEALVINLTNKSNMLVEKPIKAILKKEDVKPLIAAKKVKQLFESLDMPQQTIYRISRSIDLHSVALETSEVENKLMNLWTAIETLIPKDMDCDQDRIVQITDSITPFQTYNYLNQILTQAASDFWHFNNKLSKETLSKVVLPKKQSLFDTFSALIMTNENEPNRKVLYGKLEDFPLLKWRLFYINKIFSSNTNIKHLLTNHKQKVEWQIRRIYRVRNLIVHSGKRPSYTNILVENLHNYFDNFLNCTIDLAINEKKVKTITQSILEADFKYKNLIVYIDSPKKLFQIYFLGTYA